jgi:itaconate CoA-transferase
MIMERSPYSGEYKRKLTTPEEAIGPIPNGAVMVHGPAVSEPPALLSAIAARARAGDLKSLKVYSFSPMATAIKTVLAVDLCDVIESYTWFVSGADRSLVRVGLSYFVPNYFHQIPRLCRDYMDIDTVVTTVSPMDVTGHFSFGTNNDFITTAARCCRRLIVEVNDRMPRVFGESLLHVSEVDAIVENHAPLPEAPIVPPEPEDAVIGPLIAESIPDGATIQLGIGSLPASVANHLGGHKDLGIHTELLCTSMVDLIRQGVVTGKGKTLHPRKHVFTVALGDRAMYEFMNNHPAMESYPVSYVNDPAIIAKNDRMISVNSILEVDLLGQCNAESLNGYQFSATGGQLDFVRGAFNAAEGKSFLAFYSTAKGGAISRVVPRLDTGAVITTPRMDTHYLVTEYGVADLKGKCTRDRALAIIDLAHPRFRDDLLKEAEKMYLL